MHVTHTDTSSSLFSPWIMVVVSSPGNRASEGGDRQVGEDAMLGGNAVGIRGAILPLLVQSLHRCDMQTDPHGARRSPIGRDHRGGRYWDSPWVILPGSHSRSPPLAFKFLNNFNPFWLYNLYIFIFNHGKLVSLLGLLWFRAVFL